MDEQLKSHLNRLEDRINILFAAIMGVARQYQPQYFDNLTQTMKNIDTVRGNEAEVSTTRKKKSD